MTVCTLTTREPVQLHREPSHKLPQNSTTTPHRKGPASACNTDKQVVARHASFTPQRHRSLATVHVSRVNRTLPIHTCSERVKESALVETNVPTRGSNGSNYPIHRKVPLELVGVDALGKLSW
jgi:hypothetical protein